MMAKGTNKKMNMHAKRRNNMGVPLKNLLFDSNKFHKYKMLEKPHFYVDHSKSVFPFRYFWKRYCKNKLKSIHILKKKKNQVNKTRCEFSFFYKLKPNMFIFVLIENLSKWIHSYTHAKEMKNKVWKQEVKTTSTQCSLFTIHTANK